RADFERGRNAIVNLLRLRLFDIAECEDVFVEKTLLRQGAKEFERQGVHDRRTVLDRILEQPAADRGEQMLEFAVVDYSGPQQRQQQDLACERAGAFRSEQFGKPQL